MSLFSNTLSRFVVAFLPRSSCLLISWLQSQSTVILEPKKRKSVTASTFSPSSCLAELGPDVIILGFVCLFVCLFFNIYSLNCFLLLSSFTLIKRVFSSSLLSVIRVVSSTYLRLLMFLLLILIPAYNSSSPAFLIMCSVYRLSKQGANKQPCCAPFSILNNSIVPYKVVTVAS